MWKKRKPAPRPKLTGSPYREPYPPPPPEPSPARTEWFPDDGSWDPESIVLAPLQFVFGIFSE